MNDDRYILKHPTLPIWYRSQEDHGRIINWVTSEADATKFEPDELERLQAIVMASCGNWPQEDLV